MPKSSQPNGYKAQHRHQNKYYTLHLFHNYINFKVLFTLFNYNSKILEAHNLDFHTWINIRIQRLSFINLLADLNLTHR